MDVPVLNKGASMTSEPLFILIHKGRDKMAAIWADNIFKLIFLYENCYVWSWISLKFVGRGRINNNQALVQIMAWCQTGTKPLSEPMMA